MIYKSITELQNDFEQVSALADTTGEPIFITNEAGDVEMVLLSMETYAKLDPVGAAEVEEYCATHAEELKLLEERE